MARSPTGSFRPLLRWALAAGQEQGSLVESLRNLAPMYRKRGAFQAEKLQLFLPTVLMIAIGASATLLYALTLFLPLAGMLTGTGHTLIERPGTDSGPARTHHRHRKSAMSNPVKEGEARGRSRPRRRPA